MNEDKQTQNILIVDDDATTRLMSRVTIEKAGFHVSEAQTGEQALTLLNEKHHDAVLLDVRLPGIDGFTTCEKIRYSNDGKYIPIIMITGLDDIDSIDKAYEVGVTDFIVKPINWSI